MIFKNIVLDVIDLCSQDDGGDFEVMTKAAVNRIYRRLLRLTDSETEEREFTLATVSGTSQYGLPLYIRDVMNIEDAANQKRVYDISWKEFDVMYPGDTTTGDPEKAYPLGEFGVQTQPDTTAVVDIVSDVSTDTGSHKVRVTGYNSDNYLISELVSVDGLNVASSTAQFTTIERLTKVLTNDSASWAGNILVNGGSGINLSVIPLWWESPSYQWYEFWPIPDAVYNYTIRAIARKPPLLYDEDWPELHEDYHTLIFQGAAMELLPVVGKDEMARSVRRDFEVGLQEMQGAKDVQPNRIRTFQDVQNAAEMPARPWIKGIDY